MMVGGLFSVLAIHALPLLASPKVTVDSFSSLLRCTACDHHHGLQTAAVVCTNHSCSMTRPQPQQIGCHHSRRTDHSDH